MVGITYALLSAALFGVSAPFAKMLLGMVSPWLLAGLLYLGSGLGLAIARLVWRSKEAGLSQRDLPWLGAAVLSGGVIGPVLLLFGLAQSTASEAALLDARTAAGALGWHRRRGAWRGDRRHGPAGAGRGDQRGLATYRVYGDEAELVTIDAVESGQGTVLS